MRNLKVLTIICLALLAIVGCRKKEINKLKDEVNDLKTRVTVLEDVCKQNNTNIVSLQTIVNASNEGDYITNITPITKDGDEIGYTIAFKSQQPITIYHGKNGTNGTNGSNGTNGTNGVTPIIGVAEFESIYYWTVNGEWLLDDNCNKIRVTGENGTNGTNGTNGENGITPQLKVEDDNWYVSYDNGETWTFVSKAKGDKGDSIFQEITHDENFVYFTLADGTQLKVACNSSTPIENNVIENGAIKAAFTVAAGKQVYFSQGNLQYQASTNTWRFAENQWDYVGNADNGTVYENTIKCDNANISDSYSGWIDLFAWGTSGFNSKYPYMQTFINEYGNGQKDITDTDYDWGVYNKISNGGNKLGMWRTLTISEWEYLISTRKNASLLKGVATINGVNGVILLPDNWTLPAGVIFTRGVANDDGSEFYSTVNNYSISEWRKMESNGAVFLPITGYYDWHQVNNFDSGGWYWSSTAIGIDGAYLLFFSSNNIEIGHEIRSYGRAVRLVQDIK